MDQVDQDRPATGLGPPRRDLKIAFRFVRGPDRRYPDNVADPSLAEQRLQRLDLQMVAAVMTDQRFDAAMRNRGDALSTVSVTGFDQDINAAPGALMPVSA